MTYHQQSLSGIGLYLPVCAHIPPYAGFNGSPSWRISFLVLLFVAMPLKYAAGIPEAVKYTGWAHGILFILYVAFLADVFLNTNGHLRVGYWPLWLPCSLLAPLFSMPG